MESSSSLGQPGQVVLKAILKAMFNSEFRAELAKNPDKAVADAGLTLSAEEMETVKSLSARWETLTVKQLNERLSAIKTIGALHYWEDGMPL